MPKITATSTVPAKIPPNKDRRVLRWRVSSGNDGNEVQVSGREGAVIDNVAICGVPYAKGEGERISDASAKEAIYFRATGSDSVIYWDSEDLD